MPYFDVKYRTKIGVVGMHYAVEAETADEACTKTPVMLSYNSPFPEDFTVLGVEESKNPPGPVPTDPPSLHQE